MPHAPVPPGHVVPHQYTGPYEDWVFNRGKAYAFASIRDDRTLFLSALAEISKQAAGDRCRDGLDGAIAAGSGGARGQLIQPVIPPIWWIPGQRFLPFFFRNRQQKQAARDTGPVGALKHRIDVHALFGMQQTGPAGTPPASVEPRFRINFPLDPATVHKNHSGHHGGARRHVPPLEDPDIKRQTGLRPGRLVILGIIEDGIPFANSAYRDSTGSTRIECFWAQSAPADGTSFTVPFGREYTRTQINALAREHHDEDLLYRSAGVVIPGLSELGSALNRFTSHGSIVMDIAGGKGSALDIDPLIDEVRIIAVQLPNTIAWDTSGFGKDMFMLSAFHYIFERAEHIAKAYRFDTSGARTAMPVTVNFSYGFSGGPHDGMSELEDAINELVSARRKHAPTALVMPSGNDFEDKMHGVITPEHMQDGEFSFIWRIQPGDRTPSYLEIWFPALDEDAPEADYAEAHEVEITAPGTPDNSTPSGTVIRVGADRALTGGDPRTIGPIVDHLGQTMGQISADKHRGRRWRVLLVLAPSEPDDGSLPRARSGTWTVTVRRCDPAKAITGAIRCWIQRDSDPAQLGSGSRQSYLEAFAKDRDTYTAPGSPVTGKPGSFVRRFGSLNGTATAGVVTLVAGFEELSGKPARYSAAGELDYVAGTCGDGPAQQPVGKAVTCSARSERSSWLTGIAGAGTRSGSVSYLTGTSAAAPFAARQLAMALSGKTVAQTKAAADNGNYVSLLTGAEPPSPSIETTARLGSLMVGRKQQSAGY